MASQQQPFASLRLIQLDHLLAHAAEAAFMDLRAVCAGLADQSDAEKKRALLRHLSATKQRLQRLHVLLQWCHKSPAVAECKRVLEVSSTHANAFRDAADQLAYLHGELVHSKVPPYDVPTALHVLRTGSFSGLPTIIEDELKTMAGAAAAAKQSAATGGVSKEQAAALKRIDFLIRCKLMEEGVPEGLEVVSIGRGEAAVAGTSMQYTARLSLVPAPSDEVTVAKWNPPDSDNNGGAGGAAGAVHKGGEGDLEVTKRGSQEAATGDAMDVDGTRKAKETAAGGMSEAGSWRWRLLSYEVLPRQPEAVLPPAMVPWLQQNLEDRMWGSADIQRLTALGKASLVKVPPPPLTKRQQEQRRRELDDAGRGLGGRAGGGSEAAGAASGSLYTAAAGPSMSEQRAAPSDSRATGTAPSIAGGDAAAIPEWAQSPLHALHAVLQHTSAKLAVGCVVMEQAKAMETKGPWAGHIKLRKLPHGTGVAIDAWSQVPLLEEEQLNPSEGGVEEKISAGHSGVLPLEKRKEGVMGGSLAVEVSPEGVVECRCTPQAKDPATGAGEWELPVWGGSNGELTAEGLLRGATARWAALQLAGVARVIQTQHAQQLNDAIGTGWAVRLVDAAGGSQVESSVVPALECTSAGGEALLLLQLGARDGRPALLKGAALAEDADVAKDVNDVIRRAQIVMSTRAQEAMTLTLPVGVSRAAAWVAAVAAATADAWHQLAAARRKADVAAAALPHGFQRAAFPRFLRAESTSEQLGQFSPETTLVLRSTRRFPPPNLAALEESVPVGRRGSLACLLLANVGNAPASDIAGTTALLSTKLMLAVCWSTPRGLPTSLHALLPVPAAVAAAGDGGKKRGAAPKRKRGRDDAGEEEKGLANGHTSSAGGEVNWQGLRGWCARTAAGQQLTAQLQAAELLPAVEEGAKEGSLSGVGAAAAALVRVELPNKWLSDGSSSGAFDEEQVVFTLKEAAAEEEDASGAFTAEFRGGVFEKKLATSVAVERGGPGAALQLSFSAGDSPAEVVARAAGMAETARAATRLAAALQQQQQHSDAGEGSVAFKSASFEGIRLEVSSTASSEVPSLSILVKWACQSVALPPSPPDAAEYQPVSAVGRIKPLTLEEAIPRSMPAKICQLRCQITSNPPLPPSFAAVLESQLQCHDEAAFLASLSGVALPAAALQAAALDSSAQQAAGLIPGALVVEGIGFEVSSSAAGGTSGRCRLLVRQLGRAGQLAAQFSGEGNATLLLRQLPPGGTEDWLKAALAEVANAAGLAVREVAGEHGFHLAVEVGAKSLEEVVTAFLRGVARQE